jgi:hypothetical protein
MSKRARSITEDLTSVRKVLMGDKLFMTCNNGGKIEKKDLEAQLDKLKRQKCISADCDIEALRNACQLKSSFYGEEQEELKTLFNIASSLNDLSILLLSNKIPFNFLFFPYTFECLGNVYKIVDVQLIGYDNRDMSTFFNTINSFIEKQNVVQPFILIFSYIDLIGRKQVININDDVLKYEGKEEWFVKNCKEGLSAKIESIIKNQSVCFKAVLDAYQHLKEEGKEIQSIINEQDLGSKLKNIMFDDELGFLKDTQRAQIVQRLFIDGKFSIDVKVKITSKNWTEIMHFLLRNNMVDHDEKSNQYTLDTALDDYSWDEKTINFTDRSIIVFNNKKADPKLSQDIIRSVNEGTAKYILVRTLSLSSIPSLFQATANERELSAAHAGAFILTPNNMYSVGYGYSGEFKTIKYGDEGSFSILNFLRKKNVFKQLQSIKTEIPPYIRRTFGLPKTIGQAIKDTIHEGYVGGLYTPDYLFDDKLEKSLNKRTKSMIDYRYIDVMDHGKLTNTQLERLKNWVLGINSMSTKFQISWPHKNELKPASIIFNEKNINSMYLEDTFTIKITKQYTLTYSKKAYAGLVSSLPEAPLCSMDSPGNCSSFLESVFREDITCMHEWFQFSYPGSCRRKDKKIPDCSDL